MSKQKEKAIADANKKKTTTTAKKTTTTATKKVEPKVEDKTDLFATTKEEVKPKTVTEIVKEIVKPKVVDIPQPPKKKVVVPVVEAPKAVEPVVAEATKEPLDLDFDDSDLPW